VTDTIIGGPRPEKRETVEGSPERLVPDGDAFLESMNRVLEEFDRWPWGTADRHRAAYDSGMPRPGTTVARQLLVAHASMAYMNHVIAARWRSAIRFPPHCHA
jgi:hypothetical protein